MNAIQKILQALHYHEFYINNAMYGYYDLTINVHWKA